MSDVFVVSDTHFDHKRIIELCGRPHADLKTMNEQMIERWNAKIGTGDVVYHGGDFAFSKDRGRVTQLLGMLNGTKHLIQGNHDHEVVRKAKGWNSVQLRRNLKGILPVQIVIDHYPIEIWDKRHYGSIHLFGHIHEKTCETDIELRHNISVDFNDFTPLSVEEIKKLMEARAGFAMTTREEWCEQFQASALFDSSIPHFNKKEKVFYE